MIAPMMRLLLAAAGNVASQVVMLHDDVVPAGAACTALIAVLLLAAATWCFVTSRSAAPARPGGRLKNSKAKPRSGVWFVLAGAVVLGAALVDSVPSNVKVVARIGTAAAAKPVEDVSTTHNDDEEAFLREAEAQKDTKLGKMMAQAESRLATQIAENKGMMAKMGKQLTEKEKLLTENSEKEATIITLGKQLTEQATTIATLEALVSGYLDVGDVQSSARGLLAGLSHRRLTESSPGCSQYSPDATAIVSDRAGIDAALADGSIECIDITSDVTVTSTTTSQRAGRSA